MIARRHATHSRRWSAWRRRGFNYGRLTRKGVLWYLPTPRKLGLFYLDDGQWFRVGRRAMGEALTIGAWNERGYTIVTPPGD